MSIICALLLLVALPPALISQEGPAVGGQEETTAQPLPQSQEEAKPPRVLGQAQTQEEFDTWNTLTQTTTPQERIRLGKQFIEQHPESGLTPFVHKEMALSYYQLNDMENFVTQGELALRELPDDPAILPALARAYAEEGERDQAVDYARRATTTLRSLNRSPGIPVIEWHLQINRALSDASYAHGLALLREAFGKDDTGDVLQESVSHFETAIDLDPSFEHAYFRLASAHAKMNNADGAIVNFARVAALGGPTAEMARDQLQRIFDILNRGSNGVDAEIQKQREFLQQKSQEQQAELEDLRKREEEKQRQEEEILLPPPLTPAPTNQP